MEYEDALGKLPPRTWPYGTIKAVEVLAVEAPNLLICVDGNKEGYVLIWSDGEEQTAKVGDKGKITFMPGGPLGGYWRYAANKDLTLSNLPLGHEREDG